MDDQANAELIRSTLLDLALKILSDRTVVLISLILNCGIFGWAMASESYPRLAGAAAFAVASWCITNLRLKGES